MEKDIGKFRQEVRANENDTERRREICDDFSYIPVSYTHLTLPTT